MTLRRPLTVLALALALTAPAVPVSALPASALPDAPAPDACAPPGHLNCVQIASPRSPGTVLDIDDPGDPHAYLRLKADAGDRGFWSLEADENAVVRIKNKVSGNCVDVWRTNGYLDQWECVGQSSQRWHLVPFSLSANTYRIRQIDTGSCFTRDDADWIYVASCSNDAQQEWTVGVGGSTPKAIRELAIKYAMRECDSRPASCGWKENVAKKSPAFLGADNCVSQLVHNNSVNSATYTRSWQQTVGWQNTLGGSVTLGVTTGFSLGVETKVTAQIQANYSHTWIGSETVTDSVTLTLKPGEYGWVTRRPLLKKVTGTWTLDVGGQPWKLPAVLKIPAKDGTDNKLSVVELRTSTSPPTDCAG